MDHVSVAASIVGIATAGIKVSIKVITLASQISTAADRISSIGNDVSLTSAILHQLGDLLSQRTTDSGLPLFSKAGLESTKSSAEVCQKIFDEIERGTAKASNVIKGRKGPIQEKVKLTRVEKREWPFLQPDIEALRSELREAKGTLMLMLQLASLALSKRVADLSTSASSGMTEQRDIIRSILIFKRQQQQKNDFASDSDVEVFQDRKKKPSETMRERVERPTQRRTSGSLTQPSGSFTPNAGPPAARPGAVEDRRDQPPERPKALTAETEVEVSKGLDTSTADDSSERASDFVVVSRTNSNSQTPQKSSLETQNFQGRETATGPGSQDKAEGKKLRLFTIHPIVTVRYALVQIEWRGQSIRIPESEIRELVAQNRADGFKSVFASLEALHMSERTLIADWINGFGENITVISLKRTEQDRREGNVALNGLPSFQLITEQPAYDTSKLKASRPTYVKVARWHVCPETLDEYSLPWVWDDRDPDYIIIERWLPETDQAILFEHTRVLRERRRLRRSPRKSPTRRSASRHRLSDVESDESTDEDSTTEYRARRKGEKDKVTGTQAEDESAGNAAVDELLKKYTTVFQ